MTLLVDEIPLNVNWAADQLLDPRALQPRVIFVDGEYIVVSAIPEEETTPPEGETTPPEGEATPPEGESTPPEGETTP
jgi:hypothetical protein